MAESAVSPPPAPRRRRLGARATFLLVSLGLVAGGVALFASAPEPESLPAVGARPTEVETLRLEPRTVQARSQVAGLLEAWRSAELFSETRGAVSALGADELDRVEAEQMLVRVDPLRAELALRRAQAALERVRSERALHARTLGRQRSLAERDVTSAAALDAARSGFRVADAALREAEVALEVAEEELRRKVIAAPFAGVLRSFPLEVGEFVQDGQRIGELLDASRVVLRTGVSDREIVGVRAGALAELRVEAYPDERLGGVVVRVGGAADPSTKKFPLEIEIPNPDGRLLPGMVARGALQLSDAASLILIPREAAIDEYGRHFVYVVGPAPSSAAGEVEAGASVARRRFVALRENPFFPAELQLVSGLDPGEEIAITGLSRLRDGVRVEPRRATP